MTYTYTARSVEKPDLVVTFTLENNHLRLGLTEMAEKLLKIAQSEERFEEAKAQIKMQSEPGLLELVGRLSGPIHVSDVATSLNDGRLAFSAWQRIAGLRLVPLRLDLGRVDNPDAAAAFVAELAERQASASRAGRFFGPLDYWAGWAGLLSALAILAWWPLRKAGVGAN